MSPLTDTRPVRVKILSPSLGVKMKSGLIYCGVSPHTNLPFYTMPKDGGFGTWRDVGWHATQFHSWGAGDWRVPTLEELAAMYKIRQFLEIATGCYWASAPHYLNSSWHMDFGHGVCRQSSKQEKYRARFVCGPDPYIQT